MYNCCQGQVVQPWQKASGRTRVSSNSTYAKSALLMMVSITLCSCVALFFVKVTGHSVSDVSCIAQQVMLVIVAGSRHH